MGVPPRPPRSPQLPRPCAAYAQGGAPSPPLRFSSYEKGGNGGERSAGLAIAWAFCVPPLGERWEERGGTPRWAICGSATLCACPSRRSEAQTSELQTLMRISYAAFCLHKKRR